MAREILYRGKRIDNSEWIEGYYTELPVGSLAATIFSNDDEIVCEDTASYIIKVFARQHSNYSNSTPLQVVECEKYKVIPKTIGQYTGLTDKNGKKIFEGDIVKIEDDDGNTNFSDGGIGDVVFYRGIWYVSGEVHNGLYDLERNYYVSVIVNIHDNPELLEVE